MFQASALTECAAEMQGWMITVTSAGGRPAEWCQPEGASPHNTTSSAEACRAQAFHHTFFTARSAIPKTRLFGVNREMLLLPICWIDAKSWAHSPNREEKWPVNTRLNYSRFWQSAFLSLMGASVHECSLSLLDKKKRKADAGMRLILYGNVSGRGSERPNNEPINASSLIRGCQSPLALPFDTCYCFYGNWYSHPHPHINIQLHLIWLLSGGC